MTQSAYLRINTGNLAIFAAIRRALWMYAGRGYKRQTAKPPPEMRNRRLCLRPHAPPDALGLSDRRWEANFTNARSNRESLWSASGFFTAEKCRIANIGPASFVPFLSPLADE
jgi:hypothetical protein